MDSSSYPPPLSHLAWPLGPITCSSQMILQHPVFHFWHTSPLTQHWPNSQQPPCSLSLRFDLVREWVIELTIFCLHCIQRYTTPLNVSVEQNDCCSFNHLQHKQKLFVRILNVKEIQRVLCSFWMIQATTTTAAKYIKLVGYNTSKVLKYDFQLHQTPPSHHYSSHRIWTCASTPPANYHATYQVWP